MIAFSRSIYKQQRLHFNIFPFQRKAKQANEREFKYQVIENRFGGLIPDQIISFSFYFPANYA